MCFVKSPSVRHVLYMQVLQNLRISINHLQEFWIRDTQPKLPFYQDVYGKLYIRSSIIHVTE